jgi:hypothetical protein
MKKAPSPMTKRLSFWSGWQDSNLRPPAPKAGAMTGLRYTPFERTMLPKKQAAKLAIHLD